MNIVVDSYKSKLPLIVILVFLTMNTFKVYIMQCTYKYKHYNYNNNYDYYLYCNYFSFKIMKLEYQKINENGEEMESTAQIKLEKMADLQSIDCYVTPHNLNKELGQNEKAKDDEADDEENIYRSTIHTI